MLVKRKYAVSILGVLLLSLMATEVQGYEIEEVVVIGANESVGSSQPEYDGSVIEAVQPFRVFTAGGVGGFASVTRLGTDSKHTAVYRNGIPVNDPGGGWFDFGTELPMFQDFRIISGPNSVMFGSSAMAGTVLMEDTFNPHFFAKGTEDRYYVTGGTEWFQLGHYKGSNGSVRTDNNEEDWYENNTIKLKGENDNWKVVSTFQDYKYDYDNCWFGVDGNDCVQEGEKGDISIRNDWMTIGYHFNDVEHNTGWKAKSERYFVDVNEEVISGIVVGAQAHRQEYNDEQYQHYATYINYQNDIISLGARWEDDNLVLRGGYEYEQFKISLANSIRIPNLYERYGDDWVSANPNLQAEEGKGIEIAYSFFQAFHYDFDESIDFDMQDYKYINTGGYKTSGMRFQKHLLFDKGAFHVNAQIQETDLIRAAKYQFKASWFSTVKGWDYMIAYVGQFDRGNDFDGTPIDDVSTFDFNVGKYLNPGIRIGLQINDILDREFEILPKYGAGGRQFNLIFHVSY